VIFKDPSQEALPLIAPIQERVGDEARLVTSGPRTIEVILPGISKAGALSWLANYLGVPREETMAIGDGNNDLDMLEWAGLGIAMGNATPEVKAAADWIAPDVEADGVAVALRRFVLQT
jgi:Cof subfamily protein (haloacid dehalogenase superfamily)